MRSLSPSRKLIMVGVAALALAIAIPAAAITNGELDGNDHPNVGSMWVRIPDVGFEGQWCSGTLIEERLFLTAAHCVFDLEEIGEAFGIEVSVTFDATIDPDSGVFYEADSWAAHPEWPGSRGMSDPHDVGVVELTESPGVDPASLPTEGLLDQLMKDKLLQNTRFTAVGYGTVRETNRTGFQGILDNLDRNRAEQGFNSLTKAWLTLPMTPSNGNGGTCYGDSGGPHFIHLDGVETDIIASVTSTGDAPCKATDKTYRLDTQSTLNWLAGFMDQ